jgi:hypothetical protein
LWFINFLIHHQQHTLNILSVNSGIQDNDYAINTYVAGYGNTTSAVNAVRFEMTSGNIDDGIIKLYGVKKS